MHRATVSDIANTCEQAAGENIATLQLSSDVGMRHATSLPPEVYRSLFAQLSLGAAAIRMCARRCLYFHSPFTLT